MLHGLFFLDGVDQRLTVLSLVAGCKKHYCGKVEWFNPEVCDLLYRWTSFTKLDDTASQEKTLSKGKIFFYKLFSIGLTF